ncbi:permeability factor 2-like isoform X2 [Neoarius graeffei]|uniref:permeability factor 2-like isoform X2 n=1 Tax=Neoarius graeffei TaxID=443677 RepID=UPI00298C11CD|nr:permeability factor 2-like isoform X2 [Neoarius graeffei]
MNIKMMNPLTLAITFLACALLSMTEGLPSQPRCRCTETVSKEIPHHRIVKMEILQPGPHCKNTEIIATVKFRKEFEICLNPKAKWVQNALKRRNLAQQNQTALKV